jgi:alpha-1,2-mannosyltransferase
MFWPPFTLVVLLPFALLGRIATRLAQSAWTVTSAAALAWVIATCGRRWGWRAALLAVAAVGKPLQANFERLNLGALLLALVIAAAVDLEDNRTTRAAVWIGLASAIKVFPALLIPYLAFRRHWRAAALATALAVGGTVLPMLRYSPAGALHALSDWLALSRASPQARDLHAQMLTGMVTGLGGSFALAIAVQIAVGALVLLALRRPAADAPGEVGIVTQLAVLLSPIGWFHYEILALPAWVAALAHPFPRGRWWTAVLAVAAIFLSGILTFDHFYPDALEPVKRFNYIWGALLLIGALAARRLITARAPEAASMEYDRV